MALTKEEWEDYSKQSDYYFPCVAKLAKEALQLLADKEQVIRELECAIEEALYWRKAEQQLHGASCSLASAKRDVQHGIQLRMSEKIVATNKEHPSRDSDTAK